jgi:hypothetical protein
MAGSGPLDLQALCEEYLAACVEALDTVPTFAPGLGGSPERSFVSPGLPAFDCCDQLTVHSAAVSDSQTGPAIGIGRTASAMKVPLVSLVASSTRCLPVGNSEPPAPLELQQSAEQLNADGWALVNHVYNLIRADLLFTLCGEVFWDGLRSINPQGGCGGWTLTLRVQQDGYEEAL